MLTKNMERTLEQVCRGTHYVDVRSGAALYRRGLAEPERLESGQFRYHSYVPTDAGRQWVATRRAARLVDAYNQQAGVGWRFNTTPERARAVDLVLWLDKQERKA